MPERKPGPYDYMGDPSATEDMAGEEASLLEQKLRAERRAEIAERESRIDPVTDLPNKRAFDEQVEYLDSLARHTEGGLRIRVDFFDLSGLADFNDLDHGVGNQALRETADGLRAVYRRKGDFIARWGGDEFAVLRVNNDPDENVLTQVRHEMAGRFVAGRTLEVYTGTVHWKPESHRSRPTLGEAVTESSRRQSMAKRARKREREQERKNAS